MIVKVLNTHKKNNLSTLPFNIRKHCSKRKPSFAAWIELAKYIQLSKVRFNKNGKPYLLKNSRYISLSHSLDKAAIAINNKPVGIDIEVLLPLNICNLLAKRLLNKSNYQTYLEIKDKRLWFTKYWTQYEACVKVLGKDTKHNTFQSTNLYTIKTKLIKDSKKTYCLSIATKKRA